VTSGEGSGATGGPGEVQARASDADSDSAWSGEEPGQLQAIVRGLRRRCPRCGQAPLFERFITVRDRCASCGLRFEERAGDTWGFWVLLDRLFIVIPFAILLFGFATASLRLRIALIVALLIPLVLTMPHRQGIIVALDYLIRRGQEPD
jgi:uncharacterized protein (DUF983 family)